MIIFIVCVLLSIAGILYSIDGIFGIDFKDVVMSTILGLLIGCVVYLFIGFSILVCLPKETIVYNTEIYALQDNSSVKGSFFLGSGNVDGTMKYCYLATNEDGVTMNTIDANSVIIIESDDEPHIATYRSIVKDSFLKRQVLFGEIEPILKTKIYIPKNSIKYNFDVDLE